MEVPGRDYDILHPEFETIIVVLIDQSHCLEICQIREWHMVLYQLLGQIMELNLYYLDLRSSLPPAEIYKEYTMSHLCYHQPVQIYLVCE